MFEPLEIRRPAAALFYAIDAAVGDQAAPDGLRPGDRLRVTATGRAEGAEVFAFGFDLVYNSQFLRLVDRGVADRFQTAASDGTLIVDESPGTNRINDVGGVLFDLGNQASHLVDLAWFDFLVEPADQLAGRPGLTGVALEADQVDPFFASLGRGIEDPLQPIAAHPAAAGRVDGDRVAFRLFSVEASPVLHNATLPADVDGDGLVAPIDALRVLNDHDVHGVRSIDQAVADRNTPNYQVDANGDGLIGQVADVLFVFAVLNEGAG